MIKKLLDKQHFVISFMLIIIRPGAVPNIMQWWLETTQSKVRLLYCKIKQITTRQPTHCEAQETWEIVDSNAASVVMMFREHICAAQ